MWRCLVSVRAMMLGLGYLLSKSSRSRIVVCVPLVLSVRVVMAGWE